MNEKLQYASMLEIPINTCSIVKKAPKSSRRKSKKQRNPEEVKNQLVQMVNQNVEMQNNGQSLNTQNIESVNQNQINQQAEYVQAIMGEDLTNVETTENTMNVNDNTALELSLGQEDTLQVNENQIQTEEITSSIKKGKIKREKKPFKFSIISVQLAIIGVLLATIFLTNAFYSGSGLNAMVNSIFGNDTTTIDNRVYTDFAPVINCGGDSEYVFENGVINFSGEGSVYSPCDGKVKEVIMQENGKYTIKVAHNSNFISVFSGLDYAYCSPGDTVFGNIPVGYISEGSAEMCFTDNMGEIISEYQVIDNAVIWAV